MFSATKVVAAAAVVALAGGVLVSGLLGTAPEADTVPAATERAVEAPASFSGTLTCSTEWQAGSVTNTVLGRVDGGNLVKRETRGFRGRLNVDEMSDARLDGTITVYTATDEYVYPGVDADDALWLEAKVTRIETGQGAWEGVSLAEVSVPGTTDWYATHDTAVLRGEGAYEGLTAAWEAVPVELPCSCWPGLYRVPLCSWEVRGVVFEGQAPPLPTVTE